MYTAAGVLPSSTAQLYLLDVLALHKAGEHDDGGAALLPHHGPKVLARPVQGTLHTMLRA